MITQKLKSKLHEQKNKAGLVGGSLTIEEYDDIDSISVGINPETWNIQFQVKTDFNPIQDKRQKAYARVKKLTGNSENPGLETMLTHILSHELAHWELPFSSQKGCPYDTYNHDKILEAVKKALPKDKKSYSGYVTNAFEDLIINPRCKEFNTDFSGQVLFWDWQGLHCKQEGKEHYTPFYEAFVKLNMHLFGDNIDKSLLKRHYSNKKPIEKAIKETIVDLNLKPINSTQNTDYLFNKKNWPKMASMFTKNLAGLLDEVPIERLSPGENGSENKNPKQASGNGIEQKSKSRQGKEEIAFGRYSSDDAQSPNITSYENLDSLYRRLARAIPVEVEAITRKQDLQIAPLTFRAFDPEIDDPFKIKPSKFYITDNGLTFSYPNQPLTITSKSKVQKKSFPDFKLVVLDNSGSMKQAPDNSNNIGKISFIPWGDNSKYHYALLGFYGIENFLQHQGIAQYIDHGLSLFSSATRYKEGDFFKLDEVRKHALNPDWGSTNLDAKVLNQALNGRESFVLSISDGEIGNWDSEKKEFEKLAKKNYYAHIQIGGKTNFTSDLESWQLPVFYVSNGNDLSRLMVDTAKNTYHKSTTE